MTGLMRVLQSTGAVCTRLWQYSSSIQDKREETAHAHQCQLSGFPLTPSPCQKCLLEKTEARAQGGLSVLLKLCMSSSFSKIKI